MIISFDTYEASDLEYALRVATERWRLDYEQEHLLPAEREMFERWNVLIDTLSSIEH